MRPWQTALFLSLLAAASARPALAQPGAPESALPPSATLPEPVAAKPLPSATLVAPESALPPSATPVALAAAKPASPSATLVAPAAVAPSLATFDFAVPRAHVASLVPLQTLPVFPRVSARSAGAGLRLGGTIVLSLGLATLMGAGIAAIIAGSSALDLEDECPDKVCFAGSRGEDRLNRARDSARATDWLLGIGLPVVTSGTVMLMYSAVLSRRDSASIPAPVLRAGPGGASLTFHF